MTDTAILVKKNVKLRLANGPKPMRVWGKEGIMWPCIAAGGRDGADARVALATDLTERPFATWTPMAGAHRFTLKTGALGTKYIPLALESDMPVWEDGRWLGLQIKGVD